MALSGLVWNYSHMGCCGCDQAEERRTHGGLRGKGKHQTRQAQCTPKTSFVYVSAVPLHITADVQRIP